jgi:flagellar hook-associated protein 2
VAGLGLSGLASGVDTSSIVDQLMALEQKGKTRLSLRQSAATAQKSTLTDLKTKLAALRTAAADLRSVTTWGESQTVSSTDARVTAARIGGAPIGGSTIKVLQLAGSAQKSYGWTESASATTITIDGTDVPISANAKIADVASAINGRAGLSVYAAVVGGTKLVLSTRATGSSADFTATGAKLGAPTSSVPGRDASYELDGVLQPPSATNTVEDAIPGVRLTFSGVTEQAATVTVGAPGIDRAKVKQEIKDFVSAYNTLVIATREELSEKKVKDATTVSDYVKGQFFGDAGLSAMLSRLRQTMSDAYAGSTLGSIGITVPRAGASKDAALAGQLTIDDAKLTAALDADAQGVRKLADAFAQKLDTVAGVLGDGLTNRMSSLDTQARRLTDDMTRMDARLDAKEKRLKAQFAAMESALNNTQTQSA